MDLLVQTDSVYDQNYYRECIQAVSDDDVQVFNAHSLRLVYYYDVQWFNAHSLRLVYYSAYTIWFYNRKVVAKTVIFKNIGFKNGSAKLCII